MGAGKGRGIFPLIATIFLFVAFNSWIALLPIYQSFGILSDDPDHPGIVATILRPAGTDLNMPLALALISFFFVEFLGLRTHGIRYLGEFFRFGNLLRGNILPGLMDLFVGVLEGISHLVRVVSFTFRLFGNMTAGEILLLVSSFLVDLPLLRAVLRFGTVGWADPGGHLRRADGDLRVHRRGAP